MGNAEIILLHATDGVRYTVPKRIHLAEMDDKLTVRFRVADVYKDKAIQVYYNDRLVRRIPKRVMAPGEMESVILLRKDLMQAEDVKNITFSIGD